MGDDEDVYVPTEYEGTAAGVAFDHPPADAGLALPPGVEHGSFVSASMGCEVGYNVLLPPGYAAGAHRLEKLATRYPVVYYLHGRGDDENYQLLESEGGFCELLSSAMEQGGVPEVIYVMAHAGKHAGYADAVDGSVMGETMIVGELLPHVRRPQPSASLHPSPHPTPGGLWLCSRALFPAAQPPCGQS